MIIHNDQNDAFSEAFIDVYIFYNLKDCVYSQPHGCY
jgi:hypothetical protein